MSDAEAQQLAAERGQLTQEQMIAAAMLGKLVQNDLTTLKKNAMDGGLKIPDVDMSQVMPSGIKRALNPGMPVPAPVPMPVPPSLPPNLSIPDQAPIIPQSHPTSPQLEFDFDKKARYEDIVLAIENLEKKIKILDDKLNIILENINDKKKLNTAQDNGTQTG
jgi:hypothetical protein